jgi:hypothetical protein
MIGGDGLSVELAPIGYQYPDNTQGGWDSNWLIVAGNVKTPGGSWLFTDPCLTTSEAKALAEWLHDTAAGIVPVAEPDSTGAVRPNVWFTEPNLAFSVGGRADNLVHVRVHFSHESAPPWRARPEIWQFFVDLAMSIEDIDASATAWAEELGPFPER